MLSAEALASLRGVSAAFLPDAAAIARYTETSTADGVELAWTTLAVGVPCRVSPLASTAVERPGSGESSGVVRALSEWTVWLPALTDVTERDRLTVTVVETAHARTFEVTRVGERSYEVVRECLCSLLM